MKTVSNAMLMYMEKHENSRKLLTTMTDKRNKSIFIWSEEYHSKEEGRPDLSLVLHVMFHDAKAFCLICFHAQSHKERV